MAKKPTAPKKSQAGAVIVLLAVAGLTWLGVSHFKDIRDALHPTRVKCTDAFCVPEKNWSAVEQCTVGQILVEKHCGDTRTIVISAAKMPFVARNIKLAWQEGKPAQLIRNRAKEISNGRLTCHRYEYEIRSISTYKDLDTNSVLSTQCDEYPFAASEEGGVGPDGRLARMAEVPARESRCREGTLSVAYRNQRIADGDGFLVVISEPDLIATGSFDGADRAKDRKTCGT